MLFVCLFRLDVGPEVHLVLHATLACPLFNFLQGQQDSEWTLEHVGVVEYDEGEAIAEPSALAIAYSRSVAPKKKPRRD